MSQCVPVAFSSAPFFCGALFVLLGLNTPAQVSVAGVEIKMTPATQRYCHVIRFPHGWEFKGPEKPEDGPMYFDDAGDYEFRSEGPSGNKFLIGGFVVIGAPDDHPSSKVFEHGVGITIHNPGVHTTNWYSVDFSNSNPLVRSASREAWENAAVVPLTRQSTFSKFTELKQDRAEFNGLHLAKSGAHWFSPPELVSRLSRDSGWLALQSWTGDSSSPETTVFVDVFNRARGERVLTIEGIYRGQDYPQAYFGKSAWLTERYFIVPLGNHKERLLVCDFAERH
jgi:hypothetical protein